MYLKALEIQGFKSFPDKTVLNFGEDITAIVGPNGSGKSNVSDAIRWVMGEQSSKSLRGAKMEDVIFGGTEKRSQMGFAQVTLVLDNTEHIFPRMEESEVAVTRRYYRSGESEYYINKQSVRLRDVNELFMDTGMGREGYSIVGQGKIDEILSVKSADRREIFEEAAGISKFRHRKEETERKLERTEENLVRINDKIAELELQVGPLRSQAEKAKKYLILRDELRTLEISVWLENLDKIKTDSIKLNTDYALAQQELERANAALDELYAAGVEQKDVLLLFSNGLHPRATVAEMQTILGPELFGEFYPTGQITSHDSEDYEHLVDLGYTDHGDHVIMNKYVYDADVAILIGHTQGNPYGGYSGGYKHCATGISHWRSIAAHHVPQVMHRADFVPVSTHSEMRNKFDQQGMFMEEKMGKKFFCCDAVLDSKSRQIAIFSGYAKEMQPISWALADKRTYVHWAEKKYDVVVFGMPTNFHYGNGMGTNPIQMMQALSAQVIRHKRILSDRCVFIVSSICDGYFHDERWPYLRELYEMFQHDYMQTLPDMNRYGEYFATNEEYIRKYRFANAFHPFHGFSMMSCGHIAEMNTSAIYIVGAREPGIARGMGLKTRATFEEALEDAKKKIVGPNPNILALPRAFTTTAVHLCMKDPSQNSHTRDGITHPCGGC